MIQFLGFSKRGVLCSDSLHGSRPFHGHFTTKLNAGRVKN